MKTSFKLTILALGTLALVYTGCKKSQVASNNSASASAFSKRIALSFYQSISGKYGAANINNGLKAPNSVGLKKGPIINGVDPYCGYIIDTTLNYTIPVGDTTKTVGSHYKFTYTCTNSTLDGYILSDSITYVDAGTLFNNKYITGQNYTVKQIGANFGTVSMNGTIGTSFHTSTLNGSHAVTAYSNADTQYVLNGLVVNISNGSADVTTGTTSFNSTYAYLDQTTPAEGSVNVYTGTMVFLGNHTAKITLNWGNNTYVNLVNLLTGELTAVVQ